MTAPTEAGVGLVAWIFYADGTYSQDKPIHGKRVLENVPQDMVPHPPVPCDFKVGDAVTYTNDYGVQFDRFVRGFSAVPTFLAGPAFVYLDSDCWWMPVPAQSLALRATGAQP